MRFQKLIHSAFFVILSPIIFQFHSKFFIEFNRRMFGFPNADRPKAGQFKRNLPKSVIFQVKFEKSEDVVIGFKEKREILKNILPITNRISQNFAHVTFEKDKTPIVQTANSSTHGYEFKTADNNKILVVTEDTLSYTITGPT